MSTWSADLHPVTIKPFLSHVGPRITIPNSPLQVFELFFTPPFVTNIVQQSNLYAKQVMGDIKYESWTKITVEELFWFYTSNGDGSSTISGRIFETSPGICTLSTTIHLYLEDNQVMIVWVKYGQQLTTFLRDFQSYTIHIASLLLMRQ